MSIWEWARWQKAVLRDSYGWWTKPVLCGPLGQVVYATLEGCIIAPTPHGWAVQRVEVDRPNPISAIETILMLRRQS